MTTPLTIDAIIEGDTLEELKAGGVLEYPIGCSFIKTVGGFISMDELLRLIYNFYKDKPFRITIHELPEGEKITVDHIRAAFMNSAIYENE